jgi:hypothetical protein
MVLWIHIKMLLQIPDTSRKQCDLHFRSSSVGGGATELRDNFFF